MKRCTHHGKELTPFFFGIANTKTPVRTGHQAVQHTSVGNTDTKPNHIMNTFLFWQNTH